jgi:ABC-type dipeptide/oligopeptide/nickel transport system ATPase subunit
MSTPTPRIFEDRLATRERVPLLIGLFGPSGCGKTYSALELATGIQEISGGDIHVIDTEARRALHYADKFKFRHVEFTPPFNSLDYVAAIEHCVKKGAGVIVVDSMSHEHEGAGGYLEFAEAELSRMAGEDWGKRQACKLASFIKPSAYRRQMINRLLQLNANFIFCFRAKDKVKPVKNQQGKTEIENIGFVPIAGMELVFEMTAACLLMPRSNGVPTWETDFQGEKMVMKLPDQFQKILTGGNALSRVTGKALAEWARGVTPAGDAAASQTVAGSVATLADLPVGWADWSLEQRGENRAHKGVAALQEWWATLTAAEKTRLKPALDKDWKPIAAAAH